MGKGDAGTLGHRYSELDLCLVFRRWSNTVKNVESDSLTNVHTDHLALRININQKLEALQ